MSWLPWRRPQRRRQVRVKQCLRLTSHDVITPRRWLIRYLPCDDKTTGSSEYIEIYASAHPADAWPEALCFRVVRPSVRSYICVRAEASPTCLPLTSSFYFVFLLSSSRQLLGARKNSLSCWNAEQTVDVNNVFTFFYFGHFLRF